MAESTTTDAPEKAQVPEGDSNWSIAWRQFRRDRLGMLGVTLVLVLSGIAVFAPLLANGRPLYVRGYLTNFYDSDAAAFDDWHRRALTTVSALRGHMPLQDRRRYEQRLRRYQEGLPKVLLRLGSNLPGDRRAELTVAAAEYLALLRQPLEGIDLRALEGAGDRIVREFCAMSLTSAYRRAAMPLLDAPEVFDEVREARAGLGREDAAEHERSAAEAALSLAGFRGQVMAARVEEGILSVLDFLDADARARLNQADAQARSALVGLARPGLDASELRTMQDQVEALADLLDEIASRPVAPAQQKLPLVTRWPVLRYLIWAEVSFMVAYLAVLAGLAAWKWVPGFRPATLLWAAPLLGFGAGVIWLTFVPATAPPSESLYKSFAQEMAERPNDVSSIVFPLVPYGENENTHADRTTPPVLWERFGPQVHRQALAKRLQAQDEAPLTPEQALSRLTRLRSHWLGTDDNGRDVLSRLIYGSRVSLSVGFVAVGIYVLIGIILGAFAGYFGGWVDVLLMRITEVVMCFPSFFLIITVMSLTDRPSIFYIMAVIGVTRWTEVMRLVRGEFLRLNALDYVTAAEALGLHPLRIVFRHVLPNAVGPVFVAATFGVAGAILIESALSFLGFGVPQPTASWGSVLNVAFQHEKQMWWITIFAGFLIFLTVTAYNLVGEGLRDALDPKLRH